VVVGIVVVLLLALALAALAYLKTVPRPVAISAVLADLRQYDGHSVTVGGTVQETLNVAGYKAYRLKDDTASIIVLTERGLPQRGQQLTVTGIVNEVFNLGGVNYTVLLEPQAPD
jgi:hypothetical protein